VSARKVDLDGPTPVERKKVALSAQPAYLEFKREFEKGCL
jgi:hypothetical protein